MCEIKIKISNLNRVISCKRTDSCRSFFYYVKDLNTDTCFACHANVFIINFLLV